MKHFLCALLCLTIGTLQPATAAQATPQPALRDKGYVAGIVRGTIMNNLMTDPRFSTELTTVQNFLGIMPQNPINIRYQDILDKLNQSTSPAALEVIKAFEKVLMQKYDYETYIVGTYKPWRSIFFTGIKYSWIQPSKFIKLAEWTHDTDPHLNDILDEMTILGNIAARHSIVTSLRIAATVESYRNWRRNLAIAVAAYLAADTCKRGIKDSSLYDLYAGGLSSTPTLCKKYAENMASAAKFVGTSAMITAAVIGVVTKPVINTVLYGMVGKKNTPMPTPKPSPKPLAPQQVAQPIIISTTALTPAINY